MKTPFRASLLAALALGLYPAGAAAQYLQKYPSATPAQVQGWIVNNATPGALNPNGGFPASTANRVLYTDL